MRLTLVLVAALLYQLPAALPQVQVSATLTGVVLKNERTGDLREVQSNHAGYFAFVALPPAIYTAIELDPGDNRDLGQITLAIGEFRDGVQVVASVGPVTLDSGEKSTMLTSRDIANLTVVGRNEVRPSRNWRRV